MTPPITHRLMIQNPNILGLKFFEPDWVENFILNEIEMDYRFDDLGLNEESMVVDIGAHVGVVSMYIAKKYGSRVVCFEPTTRNFKKLVENIKLNNLDELIYFMNMAVTKDGRNVNIGISEEWGANDIYGIHTNKSEEAGSMAIKDILMARNSWDLVKIDCELAEFEILEDLEPFRTVKAIRGEFHSRVRYDIENLLTRVLTVVPNTRVTMQYSGEIKKQMRREKRKLERIKRDTK